MLLIYMLKIQKLGPRTKKEPGLMLRTGKSVDPGLTPETGPSYPALRTKQSAFFSPIQGRLPTAARLSEELSTESEDTSHVLRPSGPCLSVISRNIMTFLDFCGFSTQILSWYSSVALGKGTVCLREWLHVGHSSQTLTKAGLMRKWFSCFSLQGSVFNIYLAFLKWVALDVGGSGKRSLVFFSESRKQCN